MFLLPKRDSKSVVNLSLIKMNKQSTVGTGLLFSNSIVNTAANAVGVAKTGMAIASLHGAAHSNATAAWIGFGSMQVGMIIMGVSPVLGAAMLLNSLCCQQEGSPIIDWYEESWKNYEAECELDELKKEVKVDQDHQLRAKNVAASLKQLDHQFRALEVEQELYLMKKQIHGDKLPETKNKHLSPSQSKNKKTEKLSFNNSQEGFQHVKEKLQKALLSKEINHIFTNWKGERRLQLNSGMVIQEKDTYIQIFSPKFEKMLMLGDKEAEKLKKLLNLIK